MRVIFRHLNCGNSDHWHSRAIEAVRCAEKARDPNPRQIRFSIDDGQTWNRFAVRDYAVDESLGISLTEWIEQVEGVVPVFMTQRAGQSPQYPPRGSC